MAERFLADPVAERLATIVTETGHRSTPPMRFPTYTGDQLRVQSRSLFDAERFPDLKAMPPGQIYRLDICRDGALTIAVKEQKPFNGVAVRALFTTDLDALRAAQRDIGVMQAEDEPKTIHRLDAGIRRIFGWGIRTGALGQVDRMGDVIWLHMQGRRQDAIDLAWAYDRLAAQEDPQSMGAVYGART